MSDISRDTRPQFGFLSVVGLFFLAILAVLVALYFYNADVRQAGDGALDHAQAYKRTIASDYARFYECMRGVAPGESAQTVRADSSEAARVNSGKSSAAIMVYPPYADYPTYPTYPEAGGGARSGMPGRSAQPGSSEQQSPVGTYPQSADYQQPAMMGPSVAGMEPVPGMQQEHGMQPGPMMQSGPSMQSGGMQAGPIMQANPSMQPESTMTPSQSMQPGPMIGQGPSMQNGPMFGNGASMAPAQGPGAYPGAGGLPQGSDYGPGPNWQAHGLTPPGMPPAGMVSPMPYGQGSSAAPMYQHGMVAPTPNRAPQAYGRPPMPGPQGALPSYGAAPLPQAAEVPNPLFRQGYGYASVPGSMPQSAPTVVPAAPTMPITSMMPPAGDTPPVLPASEAGQTDAQIVAARQAYANQQHQDAIRIYRGYISRNGSDPSAFGELGNVLLAVGRGQEAAQAYYEAASRLIDLGQPGTVYLLLPHIEQHDPLLGAVLMRRLASLPRSIY